MRILWFSATNVGYAANNVRHNGGGWVVALAQKISAIGDVELAVAFEGLGTWGDRRNGIRYYPIPVFQEPMNRLKRKIRLAAEEELLLPEMQKIIADFQPEVIHVFGSENAFGLICKYVDIPCIIHLQGFLPAYYNAKFPPGISRSDFLRDGLLRPIAAYRFWWMDRVFRHRAKRETEIVRNCPVFFGRTAWDRSIVRLYHPDADYFYCSEMLRPEFYAASGKWRHRNKAESLLVSILSSPVYKGHDLILKSAALLKRYCSLKFRWKVFGIGDMLFWEKKLGISAESVGVECCGVASAEQLREVLLAADLFVHPSYIDNSPNSVCEAQLLGVPVIAANTGGLASLIEENKTGLLVPANDPIAMADRIRTVCESPELAVRLGEAAGRCAAERHAPEMIVNTVLRTYRKRLERRTETGK